MPKIRLRQGLEANLPTLNEGEPGFTTDTKKLFIGSSNGNVELSKKEQIDNLQGQIDTLEGEIGETNQRFDDLQLVDANAEVLAARGEESTLGVRLDKVASSLADKATKITNLETTKMNKGDTVTVSQIDKNLGKFDQTYMTPEFLQQIAGTTPVNAVPARESLGRGHLMKNTVTPELLSFVEKPNNLFNINDVTKGYTISSSTGALVANASFSVTDFVYIKPNQAYIMKDMTRYALYDQAGTFISSSTALSFTTPANAYFARFVAALNMKAQVNEGTTLLTYDSYEFTVKSTNKTPFNIIPSPKSVGEDAVKEKAVNPSNTTFLVASNNLFNKNDIQLNKSVDISGAVIDETGRVLSDFIVVEPESTYAKTTEIAFRIAQYDKQKNFISRTITNAGDQNFTVLYGCHYIRISPVESNTSSLMLNKGTVPLPYEDYKFTLKSSIKHPIAIDSTLIPVGSGNGDGSSSADLGEQFIYNDSSVYTTGQSKTICDVALKGIVDVIEFSANKIVSELQIYYKTAGGEVLYDIVSNNGGASLPCTFQNLQTNGSAIMEFIEFDDTNKLYKVYAKNLTFANGFKVVAKNSDTVNANITVRVVSRQYA